jgi:hypothetical protein
MRAYSMDLRERVAAAVDEGYRPDCCKIIL